MANFLINAAAGIASLAIPLGELGSKSAPEDSCSVEIGVGGGIGNTGGSVPHVALWDQWGDRIGQYHGAANGHIDASSVKTITIKNDQGFNNNPKQPEYLMLTMNERDAICVSMITASGNGAEWTWLGDMGKTCGADWFPSNFKIGDGTYTPDCVWIDQDHSNKIRSQGFSLHMPDFSPSDGHVQQYNDNPDSLCKSSKRMTFWYDIWADDTIPFFEPPLEYLDDGTDKDLSRIIDRDVSGFPHAKKAVRKRADKNRNSNIRPGHLTVSHNPQHSAKDVCEHPNSLGSDMVTTVDGTYCDLKHRHWYNLCSPDITTHCFDLEKHELRDNITSQGYIGRRDEVGGSDAFKKYGSVDTWIV